MFSILFFLISTISVVSLNDSKCFRLPNNPELVSTDPHAWLVSAWYWKSRVKSFVSQGFDATTTKGLAPLIPSHERRRAIYVKVREAFGLNIV